MREKRERLYSMMKERSNERLCEKGRIWLMNGIEIIKTSCGIGMKSSKCVKHSESREEAELEAIKMQDTTREET